MLQHHFFVAACFWPVFSTFALFGCCFMETLASACFLSPSGGSTPDLASHALNRPGWKVPAWPLSSSWQRI